MKQRFDHIGLTVSDMDRSVEWYAYLLRAEPVVRDVWKKPYTAKMVGYERCAMECAYFDLPGGGQLELVEYRTPHSVVVDMETYNIGNGHLCLRVDDIHAEYERLQGRATFRSDGPVEIDWGINMGGWGLYLRDPDGITVQLMQ